MREQAFPGDPVSTTHRPTITVLRGRPDDVEVAALVAALAAAVLSAATGGACGGAPVADQQRRGAWADPDRWQTGSARQRAGAWRLAVLPR